MPLVESFSGIRGIFDESLTEQVALRYTYSFFDFLTRKNANKTLKIVIGTDTRPSRNIIKNAAVEALNCEIIDLGIAPTPAVEFAVRHYKADCGIIITASHNEPYWNGFKFLDKDGAVLRPKDIEKVINCYNKIKGISEANFLDKCLYKDKKDISRKKIVRKYEEINHLYPEFVLGFLTKKDIKAIKNSKLRIIIDPNGGTGIIAKKILERLGVKVIGINMKYGVFNRTVEPNVDSLIYLKGFIEEKKADFAAAFDCDADRVEMVMPNGRLVSGHYLLALIADNILSEARGREKQTVVVNNATSNIVRKVVEKHNAKLREVEVGEINVADEMRRLNSLVGGEGSSSGVIIKPSKCRDGILTLLYILKIAAEKRKSLENILKEYPQYCTLAAKIEFKQKHYNKIRKFLKNHYNKKGYKIREGSAKGSLKILISKDSFIWFRASKTEANIFRIIADATTASEAQKLLDEGKEILERAK